MAETTYVSRIGAQLKARNITVSELQRRLASRRVRVSRGALDRITSDRPIESVSLPVIMPVLDELDLAFEEAFQPLSESEAATRLQAQEEAKRILATIPRSNRPQSFSQDVEQELKEVAARAQALLRERRPDLFDSRGRLRRRRATEEIARNLNGRRYADEQQYIAITSSPTDTVEGASLPSPDVR